MVCIYCLHFICSTSYSFVSHSVCFKDGDSTYVSPHPTAFRNCWIKCLGVTAVTSVCSKDCVTAVTSVCSKDCVTAVTSMLSVHLCLAACHSACDGCTDAGADRCIRCKLGYQLDEENMCKGNLQLLLM